jgi:hypothetical protein
LASSASRLLQNNHNLFHHWLPRTAFFQGGFLNFRKLNSLTKDEFDANFVLSRVQIAPSFIKDVVNRFSSYYSRQGQPDIDYGDVISNLEAPATQKSVSKVS